MQAKKPMLASELIKFLQQTIVEAGDLPVYLPKETCAYYESEKYGKDEVVCAGVFAVLNEPGEPDDYERVLLLDPLAYDAYI